MAPIRWKLAVRNHSGRTNSGLFFLLDAVADDINNVRIAFVLFFDEGGIIDRLVCPANFLFLTCRGAISGLLALLLGLGIFQRDEFGIRIGRASCRERV